MFSPAPRYSASNDADAGPSGGLPLSDAASETGTGHASVTHRSDIDAWPSVSVAEVIDPREADFVVPPSRDLAVVLVTAGSYVVESARGASWQSAVLMPGRFAVTPPGHEIGARWSVGSAAELRSIHVRIAGELLADVYESLPDRRSRHPNHLSEQSDFLRATVLELARASRAGAPALYAESLALSLATHLELGVDPETTRSAGGLSAREVALVVDRMRDGLADDMRLDDLARSVHLSRHHFLRRFAAATGNTPMRVLTAMRMHHADDLLRATSMTVSEVAIACGYANLAAFSTAFRRAHGVAPRDRRVVPR